MKACYMVAMEMSKSPKPRHFSDSSRERRDKNRHGRRTKSYLKEKMSEEDRLWKKKTGSRVPRSMCVFSCCWWWGFFLLLWLFLFFFFFSENSIKAEPQSKHASPSRDGAAGVTDMASLVWLRKSHHYCLSLLKQQESNMRGWQAWRGTMTTSTLTAHQSQSRGACCIATVLQKHTHLQPDLCLLQRGITTWLFSHSCAFKPFITC